MNALLLFALLCAGCAADVLIPQNGDSPNPTDGSDDQDDDSGPEGPALAVVNVPRHGTVVASRNQAIAVQGYATQTGKRFDIQLLSDPTALASWATVATTSSSGVAETVGGEARFTWSATVLADELQATFPRGGALRLRVIDDAGEVVPAFATESEPCLAANAARPLANWIDCAYPLGAGIVIVSDETSPADTSNRPRYLDHRGAIEPEDTAAYYVATNAPTTLAQFKTRYAFGDDDEVSATYYNAGDLRVGRDMHCVEFTASNNQRGLACYSSNYGTFSGPVNEATELAVLGFESGINQGAFATVCMVYDPSNTNNLVSFVVYNAAGNLANEAQLDQYGDNASVPNNCMNCHGSGSSYNASTRRLTGARFLPFDPAAFTYSTAREEYGYDSQAEAFRQLNAMIARANPAPGVTAVLDGLYPDGVATVNAAAEPEFVPPGWDVGVKERAVYKTVVAPFCRGCHQTHVGPDAASTLTFATAEEFTSRGSLIASRVCGEEGDPEAHAMPSAEVVATKFWNSGARAYLLDFLTIRNACAP